MRAVITAVFVLAGIGVGQAEGWKHWPMPANSTFFGVGYRHDDDGALIIFCDRENQMILLGWDEPRAKWTINQPMKVTTRADGGTTNGPSNGHALSPTRMMVREQATFDIHTMGQAQRFFAIGDGTHARIFPTVGFRDAVRPVLRACGDDW